ncbi:helix-turn-helix transcriptional regulator [Rubripirellula lacrimiformis]|nr:MarR family transcriptional regulator [Rubripirellula lacrimiformis]
MSHSAPLTEELRTVDRKLLLAMRGGDAIGVGELTDILGVTATAIRQRIERLLELGLIDREKLVAGRGRPTYKYFLTVAGHSAAGANPVELADSMWREILLIEDQPVRRQVLSGVASRLGKKFAAEMGTDGDTNESLESRITRLSEVMTARHMVTVVTQTGELPVLDIGACPYPSLTGTTDDRAMCRLEEEMISEALGTPVHLSSCRLDGDSCCQFSAAGSQSDTAESSAATDKA